MRMVVGWPWCCGDEVFFVWSSSMFGGQLSALLCHSWLKHACNLLLRPWLPSEYRWSQLWRSGFITVIICCYRNVKSICSFVTQNQPLIFILIKGLWFSLLHQKFIIALKWIQIICLFSTGFWLPICAIVVLICQVRMPWPSFCVDGTVSNYHCNPERDFHMSCMSIYRI